MLSVRPPLRSLAFDRGVFMLSKYLAFLALLAVACSAVGCSGDSVPGGSILRDATRAEVFRVGEAMTANSAEKTIGGYPILATGKEQGRDFATRLSKVLRSSGVTKNQ